MRNLSLGRGLNFFLGKFRVRANERLLFRIPARAHLLSWAAADWFQISLAHGLVADRLDIIQRCCTNAEYAMLYCLMSGIAQFVG